MSKVLQETNAHSSSTARPMSNMARLGAQQGTAAWFPGIVPSNFEYDTYAHMRISGRRANNSSITSEIFETTVASYGGEVANILSFGHRVENLLAHVVEVVSNATNTEVAKSSSRVLLIIQDALRRFEQRGIDLSNLPQLHAAILDDGAVSIEWIFSDFRIGFTIETNGNDSGWFLVSTDKHGEINAFGYLSVENITSLIEWLLAFVLMAART